MNIIWLLKSRPRLWMTVYVKIIIEIWRAVKWRNYTVAGTRQHLLPISILSPGIAYFDLQNLHIALPTVESRVEKFARIMYPVSRISLSPGLAVCPLAERFHGNDNGYRDLVPVTFLPHVHTWNTHGISVSRDARTKRTIQPFNRSFHRHFDAFVCLPALSLCDDR